ncbi:MAG: hypothetical protein H0T43_10540 [Solirubrobacterales bacterium]|nr:hypothetical protein [Solirubrobacterales bacterium]
MPTASADTTDPVWTCRASAAYVELDPLLGSQRVEPIQANGFPDRDTPDRAQCAKADQGVPNITIPPGPENPGLQLTLQAPFARTNIQPELGPAREQTASATGGVTDPVAIDLGPGQLVIAARGVTSQALARCVSGAPELTGSSAVAELTINGNVIAIPPGQDEVVIDQLLPLVRIVLNEKVVEGSATSDDQALTQRAVHVQLLAVPGGMPVANVVLGESKVDRHGATCAPPPPPPTCPEGSVAQPGSDPLVCALTVTAPCPAGSTADPAAGGACVVVRQAPPAACPNGTVRDPNTSNCILLVQRPCPAGATSDPQTRVCVVNNTGTGTGSDGNGINGSNGGIGSANGPRVTCGRVSMRFVLNRRQSITNRFGRRLVTRGRLVTCGRNPRPIVGAKIDVTHVIRGGKRLTKTGLRSRPGGRLTLILPLNLRTRSIQYSYRPDLRRQRVSSRRTLRLTVRSNNTGRILR